MIRVAGRIQEKTRRHEAMEGKLVDAGTACSGGGFAQKVSETVTDRAATKMTEIIFSASVGDSVSFWSKRLQGFLLLSTFPTESQMDATLDAVTRILAMSRGAGKKRKQAATKECEVVADVVDICLCRDESTTTTKPRLNKALLSLVAAHLYSSKADDLSNLHRILVPGAPLSLVHVAALVNGASRDVLKDLNVRLFKEKTRAEEAAERRSRAMRARTSYLGLTHDPRVEDENSELVSVKKHSNRFRRDCVRALAEKSMSELLSMFSQADMYKVFFRSIHAMSGVHQMVTRGVRVAHVATVLHILRGNTYPKTKQEFERSRWGMLVAPTFRRLSKDPLFDVNVRNAISNDEGEDAAAVGGDAALAPWLSTTFDARLAGAKMPRVYRNDPESWFARKGHSQESWIELLQKSKFGLFTARAMLRRVRYLVRLNIPPSYADAILRREAAKLDMPLLLNVSCMLSSEFTDEAVKELCALRDSRLAKIAKRRAKKKSEESGDVDGAYETVVKVDVGEESYRDRNGKLTTRRRFVPISRGFEMASVETYHDVIGRALDVAVRNGIDDDVAIENRARTSTVVLLTSELRMNPTRSGIPPSVPSYADAQRCLWRGESVSMAQQLSSSSGSAAASVDRLLVGVTWRTPKRPTGSTYGYYVASKVLDLSVACFDENFNYLYDCSWQNLAAGGMRHSGDWYGQTRSSQGQDRARETVEINFDKLRDGVKYVAVTLVSYGGDDLSTFDDASAYVANPNAKGTGPGDMQILTAQRIGGRGTTNLACFMDIKTTPGVRSGCTRSRDVIVTNVDDTLAIGSRDVRSGARSIAACLKRVVEARQMTAPLHTLALFQAAALSDRVVVVHGGASRGGDGSESAKTADGGTRTAAAFDRKSDESTFRFFKRVQAKCAALESSRNPLASLSDALKLVRSSGEGEKGDRGSVERIAALRTIVVGDSQLSHNDVAVDAARARLLSSDSCRMMVVNMRSNVKTCTTETFDFSGARDTLLYRVANVTDFVSESRVIQNDAADAMEEAE